MSAHFLTPKVALVCTGLLPVMLGAAIAKEPLASPKSTTGAKYVEPSSKSMLQDGQLVGNLLPRSLDKEAIVQKLGLRTYWVHKTFYNALFYVGDKGVLVFDAPQYRTPSILKALRKITDKPITAIVYSHFHANHIADVKVLLDDAKKSGVTPRIIASARTEKKMQRLKSGLPMPTETVQWPAGKFSFEGMTVRLSGFEPAFHTSDHSAWLLEGQNVLHAPDLVNGDQLPFLGFAISESPQWITANLQQAKDLPWKWLSGGHGNVATRKDISLYMTYYADLKAALAKASEGTDYFQFVDPTKANNHADFTANWQNAVVEKAVMALQPKYGRYYGFKANTLANARFVLATLDSYQ